MTDEFIPLRPLIPVNWPYFNITELLYDYHAFSNVSGIHENLIKELSRINQFIIFLFYLSRLVFIFDEALCRESDFLQSARVRGIIPTFFITISKYYSVTISKFH